MASSVPVNDPTSYRRWRARAILVLFALSLVFFVGITLSPLKSGFADAPDRGPGDVRLFRAMVDRMHAGQSYYDAAAIEMRQRGYPTRSVFNWRMPLPMWLSAQLPDVSLSKALLGLLACLLLCLSFHLAAKEGGLSQGYCTVLLLAGALLPCVLGDLVLLSELWSGVLIALSAVCYGLNRPRAGVIAGIAALFMRELAAPYCIVCLGLALWQRRPREIAGWALGLATYAVYLACHFAQVLPRILPDDIAHTQGWIRFGAAGFLISTAQMNTWLLLLPQWVTGIYLACVLGGCASWNSPAGLRIGLTVSAYAIAFSVAGHDFNQYWGSLTAPLFCLAAGRFPGAAGRLWHLACDPAAASTGSIAIDHGPIAGRADRL